MTVPKPSPSNINFGLLPPVKLEKMRGKRSEKKKLKKEKAALRAEAVLSNFFAETSLYN